MFDPASVIAEEIRKEAATAVRVNSWRTGQGAAKHRSTSVSACRHTRPGDSIYPVRWTTCPHLGFEPIRSTPSLRKSYAIALLGMTNSRVKDYFDLSCYWSAKPSTPICWPSDQGDVRASQHGRARHGASRSYR